MMGGRYDWAEDDTKTATRTVATGVVGAWTSTRVESKAFTGRAGLVYVAENGLTPYLSYAESFQPATSNTNMSFTQTPFEPVTGKQWEAGLKYQPANFDGLFTLSVYDLRQQNILTTDPDPTHNICGALGASQCMIQGGESRVRGVELEARITPFDGFSVIGAVSRMDSEVLKDNAGNQGNELIMVPEWSGSLWADYTFQNGGLEGLSLAAGVRYTDETYGESANLFVIPSYTLWDAAIRYNVGKIGSVSTQLALNINNIEDRTYVSSCTGPSSCFYGSGRTVTATAKFSW